MSQPPGRPRDASLHAAILGAVREVLMESSYADLSMDGVAARAQVGKKTLYRRWASKAPLVAEAVLDAYGRGGSFDVPDTGDLGADLQCWLIEHGEFIAEPANAKLIRALVAACARRCAPGCS
ncbi:TetR/AcrR family transcriptional regulator [Mycolicibacterium gadium]|uniref:TetR/AcrR family transcriptional regulator n=1 Tax=Mycolicibacterium gadium TaxID=1794 RepID=UPI0021F38FF7|nr:TetR/AcrR family transcriptional regulator [Mycolicibacterium gadium]